MRSESKKQNTNQGQWCTLRERGTAPGRQVGRGVESLALGGLGREPLAREHVRDLLSSAQSVAGHVVQEVGEVLVHDGLVALPGAHAHVLTNEAMELGKHQNSIAQISVAVQVTDRRVS